MDGVRGGIRQRGSNGRRVAHGGWMLIALLAMLITFGLLAAGASAHSAHRSRKVHTAPRVVEAPPEEQACQVYATPHSFPDIGEFEHASSIATIIEVECRGTYAERKVRIAANELWARCGRRLSWLVAPNIFTEEGLNEGKEIEVELENDGNASAVAFGGPSCAAGGSLITADLEAGTHPTTTTEFVVEAPQVTKPGLKVVPEEGAIEDSVTSSITAIAEIEFPPGYAEEPVALSDRQLAEKCEGVNIGDVGIFKVIYWGPDESFLGANIETNPEAVILDNDGNAFVVIEGLDSCKPGNTLLEASLENPPYTTYQANLKVLPPKPTYIPPEGEGEP